MVKIGKREIAIGTIIAFCGVLIAFLGLVYPNRPIVDYNLAFPSPIECKIGDVLNLDTPRVGEPYFDIHALIRNRGGVDAYTIVSLTLENASFTNKELEYEYLENDTVVKIQSKAIAKQEKFGYYSFQVVPNVGCESFSVHYQLKNNGSASDDFFVELINYAWDPSPTTTYMEFSRIDEDSFERIK